MTLKLALLLISAILFIAAATTTAEFIEASNSANNVTQLSAQPTTVEPVRIGQTSDEASADVKVVLLTLRGEGFEPAEMQLAAGEYLLVVRNRSGLKEVNVRLVRDNSELLGQAKVGARHRDWKPRLRLTPGTYVLAETNYPEWSMRIVVNR